MKSNSADLLESERGNFLKIKSHLLEESINKIKNTNDPEILKRLFGVAIAVSLQKKSNAWGNTTSEGRQLLTLLNSDKELTNKYFLHENISYRELRKFAKSQLYYQNVDNKVQDAEHKNLEHYFAYETAADLQEGGWFQQVLDKIPTLKKSSTALLISNHFEVEAREVKNSTVITPPYKTPSSLYSSKDESFAAWFKQAYC